MKLTKFVPSFVFWGFWNYSTGYQLSGGQRSVTPVRTSITGGMFGDILEESGMCSGRAFLK